MAKKVATKKETVEVDLSSLKSIQKAEDKKLRLENRGFTFVGSIPSGVSSYKLNYVLKT